jgi:nucleoside-diphosphate-sugar epimerase
MPKIWFGAVDVRDVADMHLKAMTLPQAAGERFLAVAGDFLLFREIATILKQNLGAAAAKVPTRGIPNWGVRLFALFDPTVRLILPELGKKKTGSNRKAREVLGWNPRSREEAILATAESLLKVGA